MKKTIWLLLLLLTAALLCPMTAVAAEADDDIYAVATTESGRTITLADAPDTDGIGDLESYDLIIDNEPVLTVEQSDVRDLTSGADNNGYFSASFDLPGTTKHAFLAGLSAGKVEEIQNRIIAAYANGADFKLEDLSFIDAEKMKTQNDGDDELCWAAAASNVLTYTGWAAQAGFTTTDDLFEEFIASFTDKGNSAYYGFGWFFNGVNTFVKLLPGQVASATAGTGGYFNDYAYEKLVKQIHVSVEGASGMSTLYRCLEDGCGASLSIDVTHSIYGYTGGHAITCWGYIADTAYDKDDPEYYAGLFIADSDSDQLSSGDRRNAKNILRAVSLTNGADANGVLTYEFELDEKNHAVINESFALMPYSADPEKETSAGATRNKVTAPDLSVFEFYLGTDLSNGSSAMVFADKIESNTAFFYTPLIANEADVPYGSGTQVDVEITDTVGSVVFRRTLNLTYTFDPGEAVSYVKALVNHNGLPAGDYTVTTTLTGDQSVAEAYYYNNAYSIPLKVRDSFLLGDADGSGSVDILDATKIQRMLVGYDEGDDPALQRGAVSGGKMSILDATAVQRWLVNYTTPYPVGEKQLYD